MTGALAALALAACGGGGNSNVLEPSTSTPSTPSTRAALPGLPADTPIPAEAVTQGMFGPLKDWPLVAVHGVILPDGRVMSYGTREDGTQTGNFIYDVWDPVDGNHLTLANGTGVDIFCSSQLVLPDARTMLIAGGDNWSGTAATNAPNPNSTLLDTATLELRRGASMALPRWYASATTLLNGEVYVQGGLGGIDRPEVRTVDGAFRTLGDASTEILHWWYPRNFVAPDGRLFGFDALGTMYVVDPAAAGSITLFGRFSSSYAGLDTSAAMFAPGRILQFGGNSNQAAVIDITGATPVVTPTGSMLRQRRLAAGTLLADGQVVATGGSRVFNEMTDVSYEAEIWNPLTGQWTVGARMQKPRLYHGNALLLPDATVLVFGGGAPAPVGVPDNLNAEIYYPPYLFDAGGPAPRPTIVASPTVVDVGRTIAVEVEGARPIRRVTFVKTGSATHGWNMDQRFVDLPFSAQGSTLSVHLPSRASDVPPGMWMLFVIDEAGVPSVAQLMRVNIASTLEAVSPLQLAAPGPQTIKLGESVKLGVAATSANGTRVRFAASGLPAGLVLDPARGTITGTPSQGGTTTVVIAASDGVHSRTATFTWTVEAPQALALEAPAVTEAQAVGNAVAFTAAARGTGVRYRWDFGDGSPPTPWSPDPATRHIFTQPGVFHVTVTAVDAAGTERRQTVVHQAHLPLAAGAPVASTSLLYEQVAPGNPRLWVVNPDHDSVSVFDGVTRTRLAEVSVGAAPQALAVAPDGTVWVTNRDDATISVISATTLSVVRRVALPRASQPYGIVFAPGTDAALVALEATGTLLKLDARTGDVTASLAVGANARHLAAAAGGRVAYVSRFITPPLPGESTPAVQTLRAGQPAGGEVVAVDVAAMEVLQTITLAHSERADAENQGRGVPNYLGAPAISPDGSQAFVPSKMDNVRRGSARDGLPLNFQNTVRAISSRIDLATQSEDLAARIDHDNASVASAALFDPLGVYLFVALETSREVVVVDAHRRAEVMRFDVGRAPQGLAITPDRRTLFVMNFMDRTVGVFDLGPLTQGGFSAVAPITTLSTVRAETLDAQVLRGKQLFYDARDPRLARDRYMSCASCHHDGGHDGRVWDFTGLGEGLRNTISLRGRGGMRQGRLHWSANFDEVQDFEGQIRALAGGSGLMTDDEFGLGTRAQPLGDRKTGVSADLDALAAYVASLTTFAPSPYRQADGTLSAAALAGRAVFEASNCAACHGGSAFTNSAAGNLENIGTIGPASGTRLADTLTGLDVPTLRDVWATAPFLHDGSAPTLETAIRAHRGTTLDDVDVGRLAAYLRELGGE